jgi:3-oxoadipate enol-lactonase
LAYRIDGAEDAPVVVLSNSFGTTWELWDAQLPELTRHFRVVRYDLPGHGHSDLPEGPLSVESMAEDVSELLDRLGINQVSFCGLSLGGMIGMALALQAPDRIDRLVLCCTAACLGPSEVWDERVRTVRTDGLGAISAGSLRLFFTPAFLAREPATTERFREMLVTTHVDGYVACCLAIRDWDVRERLHALRTPTLVIAGAQDFATTVGHAEWLATSPCGTRSTSRSALCECRKA